MADSLPHDIKPLPNFYPIPWLWLIVIGVSIIFVLALYLWKKRKKININNTTSRITPKEKAFNRLKKLEDQRVNYLIDPREYASQLSLTFREYIEETFSFNAMENTVYEFCLNFSRNLKNKIIEIKQEQISDFDNKAKSILRKLERIAFAHDSNNNYSLDSKEIAEVVEWIKEIINDLDQLLVDTGNKNDS